MPGPRRRRSAPSRLRRPAGERRAHLAPRPARAPPPHPAPRLRLDLRTGVADRVPPARFGNVGSRFGHRRGTPLHHATGQPDDAGPVRDRAGPAPRRRARPDHDGRGHGAYGSRSRRTKRSRTSISCCGTSAMPHRRRRSSSSTTAVRTARPTRPRRWLPSWATSRSCGGRARWGSGARTAKGSRPVSRVATTPSSRSTPISRTTRPTSPGCSAAIDQGADLAIGSRYVEGGSVPHWHRVRLYCSKAANRYAAWALDLEVRDATSGFRAYRADTLRRIAYADSRSTGYGFHVELTQRVQAAGGRIVEVPISFTDRVRGRSKMSIAIIAEAVTNVTLWGARARLPDAVTRAG